jgi:hypothetical protein
LDSFKNKKLMFVIEIEPEDILKIFIKDDFMDNI